MSDAISGRRILGLLLILLGLGGTLLGVATVVASFDGPPLGLTLLGLIPYISLLLGGTLLVSGVKLLKSSGASLAALDASTPQVASTNGPAKPASAVAGAIVLALYGWWYFGGGLETHANRTMQDIENKVAAAAVTQYGIAERNGTAMDVCVQAGFVTAAFLQAKDEPHYQQWKQTENTDCAKAGIER